MQEQTVDVRMYTLSPKLVTVTLPLLPMGTSKSFPDLYPIVSIVKICCLGVRIDGLSLLLSNQIER
jgi:hypothetical protein